MFRQGFGGCQAGFGFPRVRGDVPEGLATLDVIQEFSPRARGCSRDGWAHVLRVHVFPACAGMFPPNPKIGGNR